MTVQVHTPLTVDDLFRAADLVAAVLDHVDSDTMSRMRDGDIDRGELGRQLSVIALRVAPDAGRKFLSGLCDMTPDDFGRQPMETVLDVIEQLTSREDVAGFFKRARDLVPQIADSAGTTAEGSAPEK